MPLLTRGPLTSTAGRAATLLALHQPGRPLVLPNVWDVASARSVAAAGFPAVATSSLAIAEAMGEADGERVPVDALFVLLGQIVDAVDVPVTADLERGYGLEPRDLVGRLRDAGVVGCNLEDSDPRSDILVAPEEHVELLTAVREAAQALEWDLVINARIDAAMNGVGSLAQRLDECLRRAQLYGIADCVYPIMLEGEQLRTFVAEVELPVNALCRKGSGGPSELAALDVARVSFGEGLYRAPDMGRMLAAITAGVDPWGEAAADRA